MEKLCIYFQTYREQTKKAICHSPVFIHVTSAFTKIHQDEIHQDEAINSELWNAFIIINVSQKLPISLISP